jgi:competence protein ComEA
LTLTEGETRALLASSLLVLLAALGRWLLLPAGAEVQVTGLAAAGPVDSALAVAESLHTQAERRRQPLTPGERIDPNTASNVELDRLPGVGPALARAIAVERKSAGPFKSLADLERVPGLGSKTVQRLAPYVVLRSEAAVRAPGRELGGNLELRSPQTRLRKLDLNRAAPGELVSLPGIGPARADAIVRWRRDHGPFRSFEDLLEVPGIGPATLARLRPLVRLGP